MIRHLVRQGESVISLSKRYGVPVEKIWDHPDNRPLRERKRNQGTLFPGDTIIIPDKETKEVDGATGARHKFLCKVGTSWLRVKFQRRGRPRAGVSYLLIVDGKNYRGELDSHGKMEVRVPRDAREAVVLLGEGKDQEKYSLKIGHLDPLAEVRGVQQRLKNLGFSCGDEDNRVGPRTRAALRRFQEKEGLPVTGEIDERTRVRLEATHGS